MAKAPKNAKKPADVEEADIPQPTAAEIYELSVVAPASAIWSFDDTGHDLRIEEQLFCRSYIVDRNPVAALRRLNYSGEAPQLRRIADKFLATPEIQDCIGTLAKRLMDKLDITAERVQQRIADVAFFDPRSIATWNSDGVVVLDSRFWDRSAASNVQSIKTTKDGLELKFYDSLRASEMLAKQLGVQQDEGAATVAAATRAAADAVLDKIFATFDRTTPETPVLPPPEDEEEPGEAAVH